MDNIQQILPNEISKIISDYFIRHSKIIILYTTSSSNSKLMLILLFYFFRNSLCVQNLCINFGLIDMVTIYYS